MSAFFLKEVLFYDAGYDPGKYYRHMLSYAVPLVFGNLFQQLYHTVDSVIVGQFNGKEALAAIGSAGL